MSELQIPTERRQQDRRTLRSSAELLLPNNQVFHVRTTEVSTEGLGIVAAVNPRPGTVFSVRVNLPLKPTGSTSFVTRVRVVHSILAGDEGGFKVGLRFLALEPEAETAILQFLR